MRNFKDFNIQPPSVGFEGFQRKIAEVMNIPLVIYKYEIRPSKIKDNCLYLQVEIDSKKYLVWTGSNILIDIIQQVPKEEFPFKATIVQIGDRYEFA